MVFLTDICEVKRAYNKKSIHPVICFFALFLYIKNIQILNKITILIKKKEKLSK